MRNQPLSFDLPAMLAALLAALLSLAVPESSASGPDFLWAKSGSTTNTADAYGVAVDSAGNVFVVGGFSRSLSVGSTNLVSYDPFWDDIFVAKYDASGNLLWIRQAGGSGADYGLGVAVDQAGNCYVTGAFQHVAYFGGVAITNNFVGNSSGLFLAKYDPQGRVLWVKKATGEVVYGQSVAVDPQGNLFITGTFARTAYFDALSISTPPAVNIFVAKYSNDGIPLWVRQASTNSIGYGDNIAVDHSGNCYITGFYNTTAEFGGITLTASTNADGIFLVRYDSSGNVVWAKQAAGPRPSGGSVTDAGKGVGVDRKGNVYLSGFFSGVISFDKFNLTNVGGADIFVAKYDPLGNAMWVRQAGGAQQDWCTGLAVDGEGNSYLTGFFLSPSFTVDNASFATRGSADVFAAKFDSAGNFRCLAQAGGTGGEYGYTIALDAFGNCYLTGGIGQRPAMFGTTILSSGSGIRTFFVAKLGQFPPTLKISRGPAGVVLSWPLWATNYQLEGAAILPVSGVWLPVSNSVYSVGGESIVSNAIANSHSFFRLRKQ